MLRVLQKAIPMVKNRRLIYIKPLGNAIEVTILPTQTIDKYKYSPNTLLALGVPDFYNLTMRIVQSARILGVPDAAIKVYTEKVLNTIVASLMKISVEEEIGMPLENLLNKELVFECSEKDEEFLKSLNINPGSLK